MVFIKTLSEERRSGCVAGVAAQPHHHTPAHSRIGPKTLSEKCRSGVLVECGMCQQL
jgi:hypothetical protein